MGRTRWAPNPVSAPLAAALFTAALFAAALFAAAMLGAALLAGCDAAGEGAVGDGSGAPDDAAGGGQDTALADAGPACDPIPVDILWVVDDSTSMCQEQSAVAAGFPAFLAALADAAPVDLRTAVVTTAALLPEHKLAFQTNPATEYPPLCQADRLFPARSDLDCECAACAGWDAAFAYQCRQDAACGGDPTAAAPVYTQCLADGGCPGEPLAALWVAEPPVGGEANLYNANGSVNATCQLRCGAGAGSVAEARQSGTERCRTWFADDAMVCQVPDIQNTGCIRPPDTAGCPTDLTGVLPERDATGALRHGLEEFRCLALVGADQSTAANLEQGFAAAWLALSEGGPHPLQICEPGDPALADDALTVGEKRARCARRFLRPDAWLVVVFVSDEDDCSLADDREIKAEDYNQCALLGDDATEPIAEPRAFQTDERPLVPVAAAAARLRALHADPDRVVVAAFAGDAHVPGRTLTRAEREAAWAAYYESKTDRTNPLALNTSIAAGPEGRVDLGMRYIRLVEAFGDRGFFHNIAAGVPEGMGAFGGELAGVLPACR